MSKERVEAAKAANRAAELALNLLERERHDERATLMQKIDAQMRDKYGARIEELRVAKEAAQRELDEAKVAASTNALDGLPSGVLVEWAYPKDRFRFDLKKQPTGRKGRYEVRTLETKFPANASGWRLPGMGEAFIRVLKKDGTPSLAFETRGSLSHEWRPEEPAS